jgi:hypothetical protein
MNERNDSVSFAIVHPLASHNPPQIPANAMAVETSQYLTTFKGLVNTTVGGLMSMVSPKRELFSQDRAAGGLGRLTGWRQRTRSTPPACTRRSGNSGAVFSSRSPRSARVGPSAPTSPPGFRHQVLLALVVTDQDSPAEPDSAHRTVESVRAAAPRTISRCAAGNSAAMVSTCDVRGARRGVRAGHDVTRRGPHRQLRGLPAAGSATGTAGAAGGSSMGKRKRVRCGSRQGARRASCRAPHPAGAGCEAGQEALNEWRKRTDPRPRQPVRAVAPPLAAPGPEKMPPTTKSASKVGTQMAQPPCTSNAHRAATAWPVLLLQADLPRVQAEAQQHGQGLKTAAGREGTTARGRTGHR